MANLIAIVLADGAPSLFRGSIPRHEMSLNGRRVVDYSLEILRKYCDPIFVCDSQSSGATRLESIYGALIGSNSLGQASELLVVHDASRPFLSDDTICSIVSKLEAGAQSVVAAVPIDGGVICGGRPFDDRCFAHQTPEGSTVESFIAAYEWALSEHQQFRFDSICELLWAWRGIPPTIVPGFGFNGHINSPLDLAMAEGVMKFACMEPPPIPEFGRLGKVLLLGGSGGIGGACSRALRSRSVSVLAPPRSEIDLSSCAEFDLLPYSAVIHAAGAYEESAEIIMAVNFFSCLKLIEAAVESRWRGNMVFLSSTAATWGRPGIAVYSASKAALNTMIESEAARLAGLDIYINAVAPAKTNTRLQQAINPHADPKMMIAPEYVADKVLRYLATDRFGEILYVRKGLDI